MKYSRRGEGGPEAVAAFLIVVVLIFLFGSGIAFWAMPLDYSKNLRKFQQEAIDQGYAERVIVEDRETGSSYIEWQWKEDTDETTRDRAESQ